MPLYGSKFNVVRLLTLLERFFRKKKKQAPSLPRIETRDPPDLRCDVTKHQGLDENDARIEEEDTEEHNMTCSGYGAAPYLFEPTSEDIEQVADREVADPDEWRLANSEWCKCGQWRPMGLSAESHCCQEHEHVVNKLKDMQPDPCSPTCA
ncbi:hypothetical protein CAPTEDRAFT_216836 [Capitella teleta]|uniref:Uncharacterized protein n=1 Tax=Capitella teleta TaxID=283909 RepID=R7USH5_CAPTE|nr:hypothetical protein CAPTEDRAFT_216836 [Capitella teleta]|eukprot:ELU09150.1 hypothetical protein CAPTEDRAFT_216836 [Capitella teleta]